MLNSGNLQDSGHVSNLGMSVIGKISKSVWYLSKWTIERLMMLNAKKCKVIHVNAKRCASERMVHLSEISFQMDPNVYKCVNLWRWQSS